MCHNLEESGIIHDLDSGSSSPWVMPVLQDPVEEMLFLRRWGIHSGRLSPAACPVYLGEEHRQPGEDSPWDERRAPPGCGCEWNARWLLLLR